jgi:hypothetical protein
LTGRKPTDRAKPLPPDLRPAKGNFARAVGALLPKVTAAAFERYGFHSAEIMTSWETIVGPDLARLTRPEAIKWPRGKARVIDANEESGGTGATLVVACNPAFALEISYRTSELIDRINRYFGYRAIAHVRVTQVPEAAAPAARPSASGAGGTLVEYIGGQGLEEALQQLGKRIEAAYAVHRADGLS